MLRILLDGQEINITDKNSINISFSSPDVLDPNLVYNIASDLGVSNLGFDTTDPYRIIKNSIDTYGIDRPIPVRIEVVGTTFAISDIYADPIASINDLNGALQLINQQSIFFQLAENFDLKNLDPIGAPALSDLQIRQLYDDFTTPIADLRAQYTSNQIDATLQIVPATDYKTFYYLDKKFRALDILVLVLNIYFIIDTIVKTIKFLTDAATTVSTGMIISTAAYILFLTINLILLIQTWLQSIPKPIEAKCITINKLLERACRAIGFTYISDFWNSAPFNNFCVVWEITEDFGAVPIPDLRLSDFLTEIMNTYNVRAKQVGNTVRFEPLNYFWSSTVNYTIPMVQERENVQATWNQLNTAVRFEFLRDDDSMKKVTGEGFSANYATQYTGANAIKGNSKVISSQFARVYTKDSLTTEEQIYNTLVDVLTFVAFGVFIPILGANPFKIPANVVGCAQFYDNYVSSPKILYPDSDGRMRQAHKDFIAAGYIYGACHKYLSPKHEGQFYTAERTVKRNIADANEYLVLQQLIENNACFCQFKDPFTGVESIERCLITELEFNLVDETVSYKLTVFKNYIDPANIKETLNLS